MRQDIALTALFLDTENPRLEIQQNHRDAVRELFHTEPKKMLRLVEDIEQHGMLNPLEKIGVSPSEEHVGGGQEEVARVRRVPATNLRRILETASVRKKFGIKVNDKGWAFSDYPPDEMFKWLRRVVHDLSSGKTKVGNIYTAKKILKYVDGFVESDLPDTKTALKEPVPVEPVDKAQEPPVALEEHRKKPKRWSLREAKM